jgi:hypothetical protein
MDGDPIVNSVVRETLETQWPTIKSRMREIRDESREARKLGFRAYYNALERETLVMEEYIMDILGSAAKIKGLDQDEAWCKIVHQYKKAPRAFQFMIAKVALQLKLNIFLNDQNQATISSQLAEECLDFKLEMVAKYRNHAANTQAAEKYIYGRMIEDCAFDKFGIEDDTLHEAAGFLLRLDKYRDYVEFISEFNHNLPSGVYRLAWTLFLPSFTALDDLFLHFDSSLSDHGSLVIVEELPHGALDDL